MHMFSARPLHFIIALVLCPLVIVGCDIGGISDEVEESFDLIVQLPAVETTFSGQFIDAESGEVIDQQDVAVTIKGADKSAVIDPILFESIGQATVEDGFMDLALREEVTPSTGAPVRFTVAANAEGYIANSKTFVVKETGRRGFTVRLVDADHPPQGVSVKSNESSGSTDSDGTVTEARTVETDPDPQSGGGASFTVAEGTRVFDADGNPLQGALSSTLAYYSNQSDKALAAFPGGFEDVTVEMVDGEEIDGGTFVSGSFVSAEVQDGAGRSAHQFSEPVDVSVTVPEGTYHPEKGRLVQEGDVIPLWSYDEEAGVWKQEGSTTAAKHRGVTLQRASEGGALTASFEASHFSYWNLGWHSPPEQSCAAGLTLDVTGNESNAAVTYRFSGSGYTTEVESEQSTVSVNGFPQSLGQLTATATYEGEQVGQQEISQPCGANSGFQLSGMPSGEELVTVEIDVSITCDQQEVRPSTDFRYRRVGAGGAWNTATLENGKATVEGLKLGAEYEVSVTYNDDGTQKTVTETVTVEGEPNEDGVIEIERDFADIDEVCDNV